MKSSKELYAEQEAMIAAKAGLDSSANDFLSKCDSAAIHAGTVLDYCAGCNDTNLRESASKSGAVGKLVAGIKSVKERVSSALAAADEQIDAEIQRLGAEAAAAAAREAREAAQLAMQRKKEMQMFGKNSETKNTKI